MEVLFRNSSTPCGGLIILLLLDLSPNSFLLEIRDQLVFVFIPRVFSVCLNTLPYFPLDRGSIGEEYI